jgi:endoglycosylceramidase
VSRFHCDGPWIRDDRGRIRIFRGANVSGRGKLPPFVPFDDPRALDPLARWGMNAIRLIATWESLEPERGRVDERQLARLCELARAAGERGLHVLVDFHQDLFARSLGGDGAPSWAVRHRGRPARGRSWFWHYLLSRAVQRSQEAFWRDDDGIRSAFVATARRVMRAMRPIPSVLGYDAWNEPMSALGAVAGGRFERETLPGFYAELARARDEEDPGRLLFVEPTPLTAFGLPSRLPRLASADIVFAPHVYDGTAMLASRYLPRASTVPITVRAVLRHAEQLGLPVCVGEFGVLNGVLGARRMIEHQCRLFDRHFASWMVWHYNPTADDWNDEDASIVDPDGSERAWTGALVRPYPRALAGTPLSWDSHSRRPWTLQWQAESDAESEIVVPPRWRGERVAIEVDGADHRWDAGAGLLVVVAQRGAIATVRLRREE